MEESQFATLEEKIQQTIQYIEQLQEENKSLKIQLKDQGLKEQENRNAIGTRVQAIIEKLSTFENSSH